MLKSTTKVYESTTLECVYIVTYHTRCTCIYRILFAVPILYRITLDIIITILLSNLLPH